MKNVRLLLAVACLSTALQVFAEEQVTDTTAGPDIDRMSERVLLDACSYLRAAERFSVSIEATYEEILLTGPRVEYARQSSVVLERPGHLRVDNDSDKGRRSYYFDAKTLTVYVPEAGIYTAFAAPPTIDKMVDAVEARGIVIPASDLMRNHPCQALGEHLQTGAYAGRHYLDGNWYHHLLLSTAAVEVQLWVAEDEAAEIRKLVITYLDLPGQPQYRAVFSDWDFAPAIDESTFVFTPPAGSRMVAYQVPDAAQGGEK